MAIQVKTLEKIDKAIELLALGMTWSQIVGELVRKFSIVERHAARIIADARASLETPNDAKSLSLNLALSEYRIVQEYQRLLLQAQALPLEQRISAFAKLENLRQTNIKLSSALSQQQGKKDAPTENNRLAPGLADALHALNGDGKTDR